MVNDDSYFGQTTVAGGIEANKRARPSKPALINTLRLLKNSWIPQGWKRQIFLSPEYLWSIPDRSFSWHYTQRLPAHVHSTCPPFIRNKHVYILPHWRGRFENLLRVQAEAEDTYKSPCLLLYSVLYVGFATVTATDICAIKPVCVS